MMHSIEKIKSAKFAAYIQSEIADSDYSAKDIAMVAWPEIKPATRISRMHAFLRGERAAGKELMAALKQLKIIE